MKTCFFRSQEKRTIQQNQDTTKTMDHSSQNRKSERGSEQRYLISRNTEVVDIELSETLHVAMRHTWPTPVFVWSDSLCLTLWNIYDWDHGKTQYSNNKEVCLKNNILSPVAFNRRMTQELIICLVQLLSGSSSKEPKIRIMLLSYTVKNHRDYTSEFSKK